MAEARPDSGVFMSVDSKRSEKAPDYWGEISIDTKNMTNATLENGIYTVRLSGWKKKSRTGKTFLSIAVDRYERKQASERPQQTRQQDDEVDF